MALYVEYVNCDVDKVICHRIGNKLRGDGVGFADNPINMDEFTKGVFLNWILRDFISCTQYFNLYHSVDMDFNMVFKIASAMFDNKDSFKQRSYELARHLYEQSTHLKIQEGELIVAYLNDCIIDGETVDAIGIFKVEHKVRNLNYDCTNNTLEASFSIDASKVGNGCLIYNTHKEDGYIVQVISNVKRPLTEYWYNDFLKVRERRDDSYYTDFMIRTIVRYLKNHIDTKFEITELQRAKLLSSTQDYFVEKDTFDLKEFCAEVLDCKDVSNDFELFYNTSCVEYEVPLIEDFTICVDVLKRNLRKMRPKIKIDALTEIHLKGVGKGIEESQDAEGNKFYKIFINN